jgi:hypothetical protein
MAGVASAKASEQCPVIYHFALFYRGVDRSFNLLACLFIGNVDVRLRDKTLAERLEIFLAKWDNFGFFTIVAFLANKIVEAAICLFALMLRQFPTPRSNEIPSYRRNSYRTEFDMRRTTRFESRIIPADPIGALSVTNHGEMPPILSTLACGAGCGTAQLSFIKSRKTNGL